MMNYQNTITVTNAPLAGWLAKLTALPFGRSRWQQRFFVLLDSELRYYKDEHSDSASHVLSLHGVREVIQMALPNHSFCLRLEPRSTKIKPWTLACASQVDLETWMNALQKRLVRTPTPDMIGEKKRRPTNSWFSQPSLDSTPLFDQEYYHAITTSPPVVQPRVRKNPPHSLSRRRGVVLPPLTITSYDEYLSPITCSDITCSDITCSDISSGDLMFPTPPPLSSNTIVDDEEDLVDRGRSLSAPAIFQKRMDDGETSPTFLLYKERFRLC
ncbi:hypothetical protein BJV82DRAFT_674712 [Fennellomyces sp. T-0311]|nr:hypothetical protein BJV82DRAFT_674712 [Fennellomyces sp. T-0311]